MKQKANIITRAEAKRLCPHKDEKCYWRTFLADSQNGEAVCFPCEPCVMDTLKAETSIHKLRFRYIERIIWEFGRKESDMLLASTPDTYVGYVKGANAMAKNTSALILSALYETDAKLLEREVDRIDHEISKAANGAGESEVK